MSALRLLSLVAVTVTAAACGNHPAPAASPPGSGAEATPTEPAEPPAPSEPAPGGGGGRVGAFPCTDQTAAGSWQTETGSDFEEITLEADHTFHSHLHERPFTTGRWSIDGGALVLAGDDGITVRIEGARCATQLFGTDGDQPVRWNQIGRAAPAPNV